MPPSECHIDIPGSIEYILEPWRAVLLIFRAIEGAAVVFLLSRLNLCSMLWGENESKVLLGLQAWLLLTSREQWAEQAGRN